MKFTIIIIIIIRYPGISSFGIPYTVNFSQYPVSPLFWFIQIFALHLWIWSDEGMKRKSFLGTGHKLQSVAGARAGGGRGGVKWKDHNYEL